MTVSPVKKSTLALGYYAATFVSTLMVCFITAGICLIYVAATGWYMSVADVVLLFLDVLLLVMFGTALSSIVNSFLSSQGQISAVGTVVSAGYGFICGAYMPISQFGEGLQKVLSFLPGTYGTSLVRNHALAGVYREMSSIGFPESVVESIKDSIDCNIYFFGTKADIGTMYAVLGIAVCLLLIIYVGLNIVRNRAGLRLRRKTVGRAA